MTKQQNMLLQFLAVVIDLPSLRKSLLNLSSDGKVSACNVGDLGLIPGSGTSPGEGNGNPLQCYCLEILWTEELGGLQSMGSQRVGHD